MDDKTRNITDTLRCVIAAGIILLFACPFLRLAGQTVTPVTDAEPVYEMTANWGSFDEIRLFRYFRLEDVPDVGSVPAWDVEYHGETWKYVGSEGPVRIEFGDCWEAMYRKEEPK